MALILILQTGILAETGQVKLFINSVVNNNFTEVTAFVSVLDTNGLPVMGLTEDNFQVFEGEAELAKNAITVTDDTLQNLDITLALDVSHYYKDDGLRVKEAALNFIDTLQSKDNLTIIAFHEEAKLLTNQEDTGNQEALKATIEDIEIFTDKRTDFYKATQLALDTIANEDTFGQPRQAIIILTNIGDNMNNTLADIAPNNSMPIYILSFGTQAKIDELTPLARQTGGYAFNLPTTEQLPTALQQLNILLRQGYKVTFLPGVKPKQDERNFSIKATLPQGGQDQAEASFANWGGVTLDVAGLQTIYPNQILDLTAKVEPPVSTVLITYIVDDEKLAEVTKPPYRFKWFADNSKIGSHTLIVIATDQAGNSLGEYRSTFEIKAPLDVVIPITTLYYGDDIILEADGSNQPASIAEVTFLLDGKEIHKTDVSPYQLILNKNHPYYPPKGPERRYIFTVQTTDRQEHSTIGQFAIDIKPSPSPQSPSSLLINWRWVLMNALVLCFLLLLGLISKRKQKIQPISRRLIMRNLGNVPTVFQLSIDSQFLVKNGGQELTDLLEFQLSEASQHGAKQLSPTPPPQGFGKAAPPANDMAASSRPSYSDQESSSSPPSSPLNAAEKPGGRAQQAAGQAGAAGQSGLEILDLISAIPVVGRPFRKWASALRQGQGQAKWLTRMPAQFFRPIKRLLGFLPGSGSQKQAGTDSQTPSSGVQQQASTGSHTATQIPVESVSSPSGQSPTNGFTPPPSPEKFPDQPFTGQQQSVTKSGWKAHPSLQTSAVAAGQRLAVNLQIKPTKVPAQNKYYAFEVNSRPVDQYQEKKQTPKKLVEFKGVSWVFRYFGRIAMTILILLAVGNFIFLAIL